MGKYFLSIHKLSQMRKHGYEGICKIKYRAINQHRFILNYIQVVVNTTLNS